MVWDGQNPPTYPRSRSAAGQSEQSAACRRRYQCDNEKALQRTAAQRWLFQRSSVSLPAMVDHRWSHRGLKSTLARETTGCPRGSVISLLALAWHDANVSVTGKEGEPRSGPLARFLKCRLCEQPPVFGGETTEQQRCAQAVVPLQRDWARMRGSGAAIAAAASTDFREARDQGNGSQLVFLQLMPQPSRGDVFLVRRSTRECEFACNSTQAGGPRACGQ
jgi:hypothetical protein